MDIVTLLIDTLLGGLRLAWSWFERSWDLMLAWAIIALWGWIFFMFLLSCAPHSEPPVVTIPGRLCMVLDETGYHEVVCRG